MNGGASVKLALELARHSTPTLTIGSYAHTRLHDLQGALESLPTTSPQPNDEHRQVLRATGTEDAIRSTLDPTKTYDSRTGQQSGGCFGGERGRNEATSGESAVRADADPVGSNVLPLNALEAAGEPRRALAKGLRGFEPRLTD